MERRGSPGIFSFAPTVPDATVSGAALNIIFFDGLATRPANKSMPFGFFLNRENSIVFIYG